MSEYIINRESLKRHCEATCHKFKDVPTSGTYGEHRLVLELLEQTTWIPVSERLPELDVDVLVTDIHGNRFVHTLYAGKDGTFYWEDDAGFFVDFNDVIAWMPLPEPYKAESEKV